MKILIVEDDALNRKLYSDVLALSGFETLSLIDGRNVMKTVREQRFDAIVMDIRLPYINGLNLTREIKSHPIHKHIPIVAVTGFADEVHHKQCLDSGCDAYLSKPFSIWKLTNTVGRLVGTPEAMTRPDQDESLLWATR